jgi:hypothetical protein
MKKLKVKKMVFKFLNHRFRDIEIKRDVYDMSDARIERYYCKGATPVMEFRKINSDKTMRYKVNHHVKNDLKNYFNLRHMVIEIYVLEWCRDKTCRYGKTYKNVMDL